MHGLRASLAVFAKRRNDILRIAYAEPVHKDAAALFAWADAHDIPCDEMSATELALTVEAEQHEGLCLETRPRHWTPIGTLTDMLLRTKGAALALDRVRNPYNTGAILRSAAFFNLDAVLLGAQAPHPALSPMAIRVAEGGAEHVALARTTDLGDSLARLRARGISVLGADSKGALNAFQTDFRRPIVLVVGNEREGISDRVRAQCDACVAIPGSGAVESLNVSIAASLLIAQMTQRCARPNS